jgi:hypothetical protein
MKKAITLAILLLNIVHIKSYGQESSQEKYGSTLNLSIGLGGHYGYYKYVGNSIPILHIDYEFDVAKNFTVAPFLNVHTYTRRHYWGNKNHPYKNYYYRETGLGVGAKGTYYFDEILRANSKWDFYLAGSLGFVSVFSRWDDGYLGDKDFYSRSSPLFLDLHIGAEYHINNRLGLFLDLSSGISTFGIAIH